jgi:hypothetical protein
VLALSPSRWLIGLTQLIEFICVDGAIEVEAKEKGSRVERCDQRTRGPVEEGILPGGGIGVILPLYEAHLDSCHGPWPHFVDFNKIYC